MANLIRHLPKYYRAFFTLSRSGAIAALSLRREAVLLPDEHGVRHLHVRDGGEVHAARARVRHVSELLLGQRVLQPLLRQPGLLQPGPPALQEVHAALHPRGRSRVASGEPPARLGQPRRDHGAVRRPVCDGVQPLGEARARHAHLPRRYCICRH